MGNSWSAEKKLKWGPVCFGFVFHVRGFGCVENHVLSTFAKSAHSEQKVNHSE